MLLYDIYRGWDLCLFQGRFIYAQIHLVLWKINNSVVIFSTVLEIHGLIGENTKIIQIGDTPFCIAI